MNSTLHDRVEAIAGAIALGEASDEERLEYREHISACVQCLHALGGEHELERVAATVVSARDEEVWQPEIGDVVAARSKRRSRMLRWSTSLFGIALAASFGIHTLVAASVPRVVSVAAPPAARDNVAVTRVVLDQDSNAAPKQSAPAPAPQRRLVVTHNIVQIARAPVTPAVVAPAVTKAEIKPQAIAAITVHPAAQPAQTSSVPEWRRGGGNGEDTTWRTVARTTTTSVTETAPQTLTHSAESLEVNANYTASREVAPVGGDTAINPQPPMIAYDEGAEGTTVFEVLVDERGAPTKCVITRSAGYTVLDDAVCKAAMKARYTPKIVEGRAVPGAYHDAFTFHMTDQSTNVEGIPQRTIPDGMPHHKNPPGITQPSSDDGSGIL